MLHPNSFPQPVKVIYYTHPSCPVSWAMHETWMRFVSNYGQYMQIQFCMAKDAGVAMMGTESSSASYAVCLAVKAAALQSPVAADLYLNRLREAGMDEQREIGKVNVLAELAREVSRSHRESFDLQRFGKDFDAKSARVALQNDAQKIFCNRIDTFPTITMTTNGKGLKLTGLCSYQQLATAIHKLLNISPLTQVA